MGNELARGIGAFATGFANGMSIRRQRENDEYTRRVRDEQMEIERRREERAQHEYQRRIQQEDELQPLIIQQQKNVLADSTAKREKDEALQGALDGAFLAGQERRRDAAQKSIIPVEAQGPVAPVEGGRSLSPAFKVGGQTYLDKNEAYQRAEQSVGSVYAFISGPHIEEVQRRYIAAGQPDKAEGYGKWIRQEGVREGTRHFASAVAQFEAGHFDGALSSFERAFNAPGFYQDGRQLSFENIKRDQSGKPAFVDLIFTDRAGKQEARRGLTMDDIWALGVNNLAPDKVFDTGVAAYQKKQADAAEIAKTRKMEKAKAMGKREGEGGSQQNPYATGGFNESQGKAANFADRMAEANAILDQHSGINSGADGWIGGVLANTLPAGAANQIASPERQQVTQAQRNFVNAILRRESGAAISQGEFNNAAQQYFPQPGDSPQVIEQKRQNRISATHGLMREAGPSYRPPQGWGDPRNPPGGRAQGQQQPNYAPGGGPNQPGQAMQGQQGQQQRSGSLAPGAVVNGFIYRGGNPKDQNSWERAQ